jgi:hypothetical protein
MIKKHSALLFLPWLNTDIIQSTNCYCFYMIELDRMNKVKHQVHCMLGALIAPLNHCETVGSGQVILRVLATR